MKLFDQVKSKLGRSDKVDEVVATLEEQFTGNRLYIRTWERSQRLRGAGYTRPMRKGRTQRVHTSVSEQSDESPTEGRSV